MNPSTTPGHSPFDVPGPVRSLAHQRGLGEVLDVRRERTMAAQVGIGLATAAVGMTVSLLLAAYNASQTAASYTGGGGTHFFLPSGAVFVIGLVWAVRGLLIGTRAHYLFADGLISKRRSGLRTVTWAQVAELRTVYGRDRGQVAGYQLTGPDRSSIAIPLKTDHGGRDPFIDRLIELLRRHDRPIH